MSSKFQNQNELLNQYGTSQNLSARAQLHARYSQNRYGWFRWLFEQFELPPTAHILELGAGPGWLWKENDSRIPDGWQITLSDMSGGMVEEQRQNLKDCAHTFQCEVIDAQAIPFEDNRFDMVTANHMLYHVPDINKALSEIRRVLRPDGKFYAATNGLSHLHEIGDLVNGFTQADNVSVEPLSFTLENGSAYIAPFFAQVTVQRYADSLEVTSVEPLIAYILSAMRYYQADSVKQSPDQFRAYLETELSKTGSIHITKDVGLFVATMPRK